MKSLFTTCVAIFFFSLLSSFAQIPTDGLVGYWPFDGDYNDYSGNANHGIAVGTNFYWDRFNNPNSCIEFNGVNGIVRVAHTDSIDFDAFTESFSVSFWCQSNEPIISTGGSARFMEKWDSYGSTPYPISIIIIDTDVKASVYDMNTTSQPWAIEAFSDDWHNIIFVNNYPTDSCYLYLDGVLTDQALNQSAVNTNNTLNLTFGNNHIENRPYAGMMDDIRLYSKALNANEIESIFINDTTTITDTTIIDTLNSITNQLLHLDQVYPNPCTDRLTINLQSIEQLQIFNEVGILMGSVVNSNQIDMSRYKNGIYFIRIYTRSDSYFKKIIKI